MMMRKLRFLHLLVLVTLWHINAYSQTSTAPLEERMQKLEQRLSDLESRLSHVDTPEDSSSGDRIEVIDQKLRILERNRELEQEDFVAKAKQTPVVGAGDDGFFLRSADKSFQLKVGGYVQADSRSFFDDSAHVGVDSFVLRRVRPIFQGTVFKYVDFRVMPDFGDGKVVLQDAYLDLRYTPLAVFRAGK